jgi:hypothetical protein
MTDTSEREDMCDGVRRKYPLYQDNRTNSPRTWTCDSYRMLGLHGSRVISPGLRVDVKARNLKLSDVSPWSSGFALSDYLHRACNQRVRR